MEFEKIKLDAKEIEFVNDNEKTNSIIKILIFLFSLILLSCSNKPSVKGELSKNKELNEVRLMTINQTENQINEYLSVTYDKFNDSINNTSGFLGWKNVRDYFSLGKETMTEKSSEVWYSVYDSLYVRNIVKENLEEAYISLDKNPDNIKVNYISGKEEIGLYAHKIGLSIVALIFENSLEWLVEFIGSLFIACIVVFGYVSYMFTAGGWIRWSKKRHEKVDNIGKKVLKWGGRLIIIIIIATMFFQGDLTENQLKDKIKKDLLEQVENEIKINLK